MSPITTHVLDIALGRPARGIAVVLESQARDGWTELARGATNADGRIADLLPAGTVLAAGVYRLQFATGAYFASLGVEAFYPEVLVTVRLEAGGHYHLPLLLSPFGYSTYRGT